MGSPKTDKKHKLSEPDKWVDLYGNYLYRFAYVRTNETQAAENLVQEALIAAYKAKDNFRGTSSEKTWLVGILKKKIMDYYRKHYRESKYLDKNDPEEKLNHPFNAIGRWRKPVEPWADDAASTAQKHEFWKIFRSCLATLPPKTARAFIMHEIDGESGKQICETLDISSSNLWVLLYRARIKLRECLEKNWFNPKNPQPNAAEHDL